MPRFRPFITESSSACPALVDVVKNVNGARHIVRAELKDGLPDSDFFDLKKMVESTDVRLDPVNPVLFPAKSVNFDFSDVSDSSDGDPKPNDDKGVNNVNLNDDKGVNNVE